MEQTVKTFPLGDSALTVCFGREISVELNNNVLRLASYIEKNPFEGFVEVIPAYSSLGISYDPLVVRKHSESFPTAFDAVNHYIETSLSRLGKLPVAESRRVEIPISFEPEVSLDLEAIAAKKGLTEGEVVEIFLSIEYKVFMLGFLPGFAYMGEIDKRIAVPRKDTPRSDVPAGSVGIAGRQTGIYPFASPGGWQIIGRTVLKMFTPEAQNPTFLRTGDFVKFYRT